MAGPKTLGIRLVALNRASEETLMWCSKHRKWISPAMFKKKCSRQDSRNGCPNLVVRRRNARDTREDRKAPQTHRQPYSWGNR